MITEIINRFFAGIQKTVILVLRKRLKHSVRIKAILYRILWAMPERFRQYDRTREALKELKKEGKPICFINVGANDGIAGDPLREFVCTGKWSGVLVEPVPFVFERLKRAYHGKTNIQCEQSAIGEINEKKTFWFVRKNKVLAPGYDQIGSFDRHQVVKHEQGLFPGVTSFIESVEVNVISFSSLLEKYNLKTVDLILIDTEGFDAKIVKQIDLDKLKPKLIIYEHEHVPKAEQLDCVNRLTDAGYNVYSDGGNTLAIIK